MLLNARRPLTSGLFAAGAAAALTLLTLPIAYGAEPPSAATAAAGEADEPSPADAEPIIIPPGLTLTNARGTPASAPKPNTTTQTRMVGRATLTGEELRRRAQDPEEAAGVQQAFVGSLYDGLAQLGPGAGMSRIPDGYSLAITGEIWLGDGGYSPRVTSYASNGGFNNAIDFNPGGAGVYGSATTYEVNGDMITIRKSMQIGDQTVVMPGLTVQSGSTAVVQLPDGSVMQVTPVLTPAPSGSRP